MSKAVPNGPLWVIGWREWIALPDLGVERIKAKIDTGARSSALHAFDIEPFRRGDADWVRFCLHPLQRDPQVTVRAEALLVDRRMIRNSGGQAELRPIIEVRLALRGRRWTTEVSLTNRSDMGFRMLLGRQALSGRFLIDTGHSFLAGAKGPR